MALPPPGERAPRPPKGKSKSRRYAMTWVPFKESSADEDNFRFHEVKSTSVASAHTSLLKVVREETGRAELKKNQIVVIEAALIPPRVSLEDFLGLASENDDDDLVDNFGEDE